MDHLALACNIPADKLRRSNMYNDGDITHFGMVIGEQDAGAWNVPRMWDRMYSALDVAHRRVGAPPNYEHKYILRLQLTLSFSSCL